ncbi:unnamed protein product [Urochloa humidicola]
MFIVYVRRDWTLEHVCIVVTVTAYPFGTTPFVSFRRGGELRLVAGAGRAATNLSSTPSPPDIRVQQVLPASSSRALAGLPSDPKVHPLQSQISSDPRILLPHLSSRETTARHQPEMRMIH